MILNLSYPRYFRRLEAAKNDGNQFWATVVSTERERKINKNLNSEEKKLCYSRTKETTERKKTQLQRQATRLEKEEKMFDTRKKEEQKESRRRHEKKKR